MSSYISPLLSLPNNTHLESSKTFDYLETAQSGITDFNFEEHAILTQNFDKSTNLDTGTLCSWKPLLPCTWRKLIDDKNGFHELCRSKRLEMDFISLDFDMSFPVLDVQDLWCNMESLPDDFTANDVENLVSTLDHIMID
jgi:hypothetical protein